MPTIFRLGRVQVRMFFDDHHPPHCHLWTPDGEMQIALADLSTMRGRISDAGADQQGGLPSGHGLDERQHRSAVAGVEPPEWITTLSPLVRPYRGLSKQFLARGGWRGFCGRPVLPSG